jgi:anti-sigma factor RsiW
MPQRLDDCAAVLPLLEPYLDGELSPAEIAKLREHLARCPACAAELRLAETLLAGLRDLPELDAPPTVLLRVRAAAMEKPDQAEVLPFERTPPKLRQQTPSVRFAALAAALVLTLLSVLLLVELRSSRSPQQPTAATAADIARATAEARYALAYVGRASRRAGLTLKDEVLPEHLVAPAARSLSRSLGEALTPDSESAPRQGS